MVHYVHSLIVPGAGVVQMPPASRNKADENLKSTVECQDNKMNAAEGNWRGVSEVL